MQVNLVKLAGKVHLESVDHRDLLDQVELRETRDLLVNVESEVSRDLLVAKACLENLVIPVKKGERD